VVDPVAAELAHRQGLWSKLLEEGGTRGVAPQRLRDLGIYGAAQGIWVDKARTVTVHPDGVTVAVLHTGSSYADDLYDDGVLYHYPTTARPPGRDASEVAATKAAHESGLPIFVIWYPTPGSTRRNVDLAWVEEWDDDERLFLITFGEAPPAVGPSPEADATPFQATADRPKTQALGTIRPGQHRFKFRVLRRYGAVCAVCDVSVEALLDAAHIRGYRDRGSDERIYYRNAATRGLTRAAEGAGLNRHGMPKLSFHDLRHSYGSHLVRSGLDVVRVSRQLGHARPSVTLDVYAHEFEQAQHAEDVREKLTAAFGGILA
jgi:Phage integrase family